ncbi:hypothetical protein MBLNU230_g6384t1 [Neophaeotheca triangularis]
MSSVSSPTSPQQRQMPTRTNTSGTSGSAEEAIPEEDNTELTRLFNERLSAWKHACAYLEDYVTATEKLEHNTSKEYERVLKPVSHPLKEGEHFEQSLGGIAGMFDNIRSNTQGLCNSHADTAKTLKGSVLPIFERLHTEIKNKTKELTKGAGKGSKLVEKARQTSQKQIELLGQNTASFDSSGGHLKADQDPYTLQRQVYHRLNKQVMEENNNREDLLAVQNHFAQFEAHVVQTFQQGISQFNQVLTNQANQTQQMYNDVASTTQKIPADFEWNGFHKRYNNVLIDPQSPKRSVEAITFPNQDHRSTQPLIAGSLERKGKMLKRYETGFFVVTPAGFLHEFKTDDDFAKDPYPEASLYLPDCVVGAVDGQKFNIKGKNAGGGLASKMSFSHEYAFKAHTGADAQKWHQIVSSVAGGTTQEKPESPTTTEAGSRQGSGQFPPEKGSVAGTSTDGQSEMTPTTSNTAETEAAGPQEGVAAGDQAAPAPAAGPEKV